MYMRMCSTSTTRPLPERLPPTERAAYYHCLRVYFQVTQWRKLQTTDLGIVATDWGWTFENDQFKPTTTDLKPAPDDILKIIRCSCKSTSKNQCGTNTCTCRKNGQHCVSACGDCHGDACLNAEILVISTDDLIADSNTDIEDYFDEPSENTVDIPPGELLFDDLDWMGEWLGEEEEVSTEPMDTS